MRKLATIAVAVASVCASGYVAAEDKVNWNGAVRFAYKFQDFTNNDSEGNENRFGDAVFDVFRIGATGEHNGIDFSVQYRWYDYMHILHHGWVGYDFNKNNRLQVGIQQVPFGNRPFNSNNWWFSVNYYVGLEDDYDSGLVYQYQNDRMRFHAGWFLSPDRNDASTSRYSVDVVGYRHPGVNSGTAATTNTCTNPADAANPLTETIVYEGTGASIFNGKCGTNNNLLEDDTLNFRFGYDVMKNVEVGFSYEWGRMYSAAKEDEFGDHYAYALHTNASFGGWNFQLQYTQYEYDLDNNAKRLVTTYFGATESISSEAKTVTANVAYSMDVKWGPFNKFKVYNDFNTVYDKSSEPGQKIEDTLFNATGVILSNNKFYWVMDYYWIAENMIFVNGHFDGAKTESDRMLYMNFGYYF